MTGGETGAIIALGGATQRPATSRCLKLYIKLLIRSSEGIRLTEILATKRSARLTVNKQNLVILYRMLRTHTSGAAGLASPTLADARMPTHTISRYDNSNKNNNTHPFGNTTPRGLFVVVVVVWTLFCRHSCEGGGKEAARVGSARRKTSHMD